MFMMTIIIIVVVIIMTRIGARQPVWTPKYRTPWDGRCHTRFYRWGPWRKRIGEKEDDAGLEMAVEGYRMLQGST